MNTRGKSTRETRRGSRWESARGEGSGKGSGASKGGGGMVWLEFVREEFVGCGLICFGWLNFPSFWFRRRERERRKGSQALHANLTSREHFFFFSEITTLSKEKRDPTMDYFFFFVVGGFSKNCSKNSL